MHVLPLHRTYLMKPLIIILMIYVFIAQQLYKASSVQPLTASGISSVSLALSLSLFFSHSHSHSHALSLEDALGF